jgi:hypothetical protein
VQVLRLLETFSVPEVTAVEPFFGRTATSMLFSRLKPVRHGCSPYQSQHQPPLVYFYSALETLSDAGLVIGIHVSRLEENESCGPTRV